MAFDMNNDFFVAQIKDCAEVLSQDDLDILQGLIKKVEIIKPRNPDYIVISKADTPKLFNIVKSLTEPFYGKKELKHGEKKKAFLDEFIGFDKK